MTCVQIAGALADRGGTLEEVTAVANAVASNIATMSVSLSPCSVPGQEPSFHLELDEMELGLGKMVTSDIVYVLLECLELSVRSIRVSFAVRNSW